MKIKPAKQFISSQQGLIAALAFSAALLACSPRAEKLYDQANAEIQKGHFRIAVDLLEKSANLEKSNVAKFKLLADAARIVRFEIQDYERSLRIYRQIILECSDEPQRIAAQEALSEIYLENLQDYAMALKELQILEPLLLDSKKKEKTRLRIAQALYLTGNHQQALDEINSAQKYIKFHEIHFLKLKSEVLLAQKKYKEALAAYEEIRQKNPGYFGEENLYIATSIVYEENEQYSEALSYLNKYQLQIKDKSYLELRIKRLKERIANRPLSKGVRK